MKRIKFIDNINVKINPYQKFLFYSVTRPFIKKLNKCEIVQEELLLSILNLNKKCKFGKEHNFSKIKSVGDFRKNVKINKYENLKSYINDEIKGIKNTLLSSKVKYFATSSGTTDEPKFIPHTQNYIKLRKKAWEIWINNLFMSRPKTFSPFGGILTFTAKPYDGVTENGVKYGSVSGQIHEMQPKFVKFLYGAPDEIMQIDDFELKYYLSILFSIRKNVTLIVTPNPSTLIVFAKKFNYYFYQLISDLSNNRIEMLEKAKGVDAELKKKILQKYWSRRKNAITAQRLKKLKAKNDILLPKHIFDELQSIGCWRGGNVGTYVKKLSHYYGSDVEIRDIGFLASEGRFTIPFETTMKGDGVLDINSNFYEFIEVGDYEKGVRKTKLAHELEKGKMYFIIITNENGLYRYFMDDIIEVMYYAESTPIIKFVQKGKYVSSITGEKVSEWEVLDAMYHCHEELKFSYHTFFVIANTYKETPYYEYHIEFDKPMGEKQIKEIEDMLELKLKEVNMEYLEKRDSQRLGHIRVVKLPTHSIDKIKSAFSVGKKSETQVKVPKLIVLDKDKEVLKELKLI